jgi:hypothetical protein
LNYIEEILEKITSQVPGTPKIIHAISMGYP